METLDKSQVPPLHQKRILAFVNHFLISSCGFLNDFATTCETKFIELERKMQKVEAALCIIEAKLASIPDASPVPETPKAPEESKTKEEVKEPTATAEKAEAPEPRRSQPTVPSSEAEPAQESEPQPSSDGVRACDDERYKKFFKMLQVGVPAQAVKLKMHSEGVDPQILDSPNVILADGMPPSS